MGRPTLAEPPVASWIDPADMAVDPYPTYHRLLSEAPVAWAPTLNMYLVTSARACRAIEADQQTFSAAVSGPRATMTRSMGAPPMLSKDDPEHAAERTVVNPALRPKNLRENWMSIFERNARTHLSALVERGPDEAELNRDYAAPVAARNLIDLIGFRGVSESTMRRWSHALVGGIGNLVDDADTWTRNDDAREEISESLRELVPYYRSHPDGSILSAFVASDLSFSQISANINLIVSGGMNEPQHAITAAVMALTDNPEQRSRVRADPSLWPDVFDETVRWASPIGMYRRVTTTEVMIEDVALPAGAAIGVVVGAANRDPAIFEEADSFDITRPKQPHLAFGSGVHLCAGHWAARMGIGEVAIPLLYEKIPGLTVDHRRTSVWQGWFFRGLSELPVTWG